jgi:hypothetical protein
MDTECCRFVAGAAPYTEVKWGVNPEVPSVPELLWVANSCALAVAADEPYNSAWGLGNQRLPFVYQHWMEMGGPSIAELEKQGSAGDPPRAPTPPRIPAPPLNPPLPPILPPPHATLQPPSRIPAAPEAQDDLAVVYPAPKSVTDTKGKGKAQPAGSDDDTQGLGGGEEAGGKAAIRVHRHAPFTMEKQKMVLSMTYDFIDNLRRFAKEENLDPTAVVRVFGKQLGAAKMTSWQAYEKLACLERGGTGMCLLVALLLASLVTNLSLSC